LIYAAYLVIPAKLCFKKARHLKRAFDANN
jgi:hypothetical protein